MQLKTHSFWSLKSGVHPTFCSLTFRMHSSFWILKFRVHPGFCSFTLRMHPVFSECTLDIQGASSIEHTMNVYSDTRGVHVHPVHPGWIRPWPCHGACMKLHIKYKKQFERAMIRNWYNQVPYPTRNTNGIWRHQTPNSTIGKAKQSKRTALFYKGVQLTIN